MTIAETPVQIAKITVCCDGCQRDMGDGEDVFCDQCRLLPDRHVEPREIADGLREWIRDNRIVLTDFECELIDRIADHVEQGTRP